ncbi:MAG: integrase [Verrucomicrobia bacterium]|nr:integrase [Verrucomicrobiota bacterium]
MSQRAKNELVMHWRPKYQRVGRRYKSSILNEFCDLTGHDRKHAIKLMRGKAGVRKHAPGPKRIYGDEITASLRDIWKLAEQPCSKILAALLPEWIDYYEDYAGQCPSDVRRKLLDVSASQIDRILKPYRVKLPQWHRRGCKPGSLLRQQIPIRTGPWDAQTKPGYLELDTVSHGGESMAGSFIWSLTATDIRTGWTCLRAVWNCGQHGVTERIREIEQVLPFPWLGADCDNGHEFLNYYLKVYFHERPRPIDFTRSRAYRKNDNAHVEQKNWTHVRQLLGYERLPYMELIPLINDLYINAWEPFHNFFRPNMKLVSKTRIGSRYQKKYDEPKTPYQRLLNSNCLSKEQTEKLQKIKTTLNPITLKKEIEKKLKKVFDLLQQMGKEEEKRCLLLRSDEPIMAHSCGAKRRRKKNLTAA